MDDTISRQAAIDAFFNVDLQIYSGEIAIGRRNYMTKEEAQTIIEHLPSAEPEWKKGQWIVFDSDDYKYDEIKCNRCKKNFTVDAYHWTDIGITKDDLKFCPNCGADMRVNKIKDGD